MSFIQEDSDEWLIDRMRGIGASDVPGIMGTCDFKTPDDVLASKLNPPSFIGNWATKRGHTLEPIAVDLFTRSRGEISTKVRSTYPRWPVLVASLDGWLPSGHVIEAKAPAAWKHTLALCGLVPETYVDQVQVQILIKAAKSAFYVSFHDEMHPDLQLGVVEVMPDRKRQAEILIECRKFWRRVIQARLDLLISRPDLPDAILEIHRSSIERYLRRLQNSLPQSFGGGTLSDEASRFDAGQELSTQERLRLLSNYLQDLKTHPQSATLDTSREPLNIEPSSPQPTDQNLDLWPLT